MNILQSIKNWWTPILFEPVQEEHWIPHYVPKTYITAYELSQIIIHPKVWRTPEEAQKWYNSLPEDLKKHYELRLTKCSIYK